MINKLSALWKQKKIIIILILAQLILNCIGTILSEEFQKGLMISSGCVLLAASIYATYSQRQNILLLLLNIVLLYFNYSLVSAVYWSVEALDPIFKSYNYVDFLRSINILLLFFGTYTVLLKDNSSINRKAFLKKGKPNFLVVIACALYIAMAPFLFYKTESFGTRGIITVWYEYSLIVMIVALRFCHRDIRAVIMLLLASAWLIVHGLLHGERILALQMMIVWGLYLLLHVLSLKLVIPACIGGILLFTLFGMYRGLNALEGNFISGAISYLSRGGLANDTSYYAYWASMSIMRYADVVAFWERPLYLLRYLLYIILGSSVPDVNLSTLSMAYNAHAGGGWLPFYANFWLGVPGIILAGAGVAWLLNLVSRLSKGRHYLNYLAVYIIATCPRWYLYSPAHITRGIFIFSVFYCACLIAQAVMPHIWPCLKVNVPKLPFLLKKYIAVAWEWLKKQE